MNQTSCSAHDLLPPQDPARIGQNVEEHLTLHSRALTGLFLLVLFYTLHLGRVIFLPMAIALLLAVLFAPFLRRLKQWHILGAARSGGASRPVRDSPRVWGIVPGGTGSGVEAAALDEAKKVQQVEVTGEAWPIKIFSLTSDFIIGLTTTVILLYVLISSGDLFLQKLVKVLPRQRDKKRVVEIVRHIKEQLFQHLFTVTASTSR